MSGVEGVPVTRRTIDSPHFSGHTYRETRQPGPADGLTFIVGDEHGRWFPEPVAAALVDVAREIATYRTTQFRDRDLGATWRALDRLDAARAQEPS